jgi:hypothetical protein
MVGIVLMFTPTTIQMEENIPQCKARNDGSFEGG